MLFVRNPTPWWIPPAAGPKALVTACQSLVNEAPCAVHVEPCLLVNTTSSRPNGPGDHGPGPTSDAPRAVRVEPRLLADTTGSRPNGPDDRGPGPVGEAVGPAASGIHQ